MDKKVLVLDDDIDICEVIVNYLAINGYSAVGMASVEQFEAKLNTVHPHFLILSRVIGQRDCLHLISKIRSSADLKSIPVIVTTNNRDLSEKIKTLQAGADEVLIKPIILEELATKMQVLLRRSASYYQPGESIIYKNLKMSPLSGEVFLNDERISFTNTEFKLLEALVVEKGKPVRRESLANRSLTARNKNARTIDVHINAIRGKLGQIGNKIKTLRGRGYMLID